MVPFSVVSVQEGARILVYFSLLMMLNKKKNCLKLIKLMPCLKFRQKMVSIALRRHEAEEAEAATQFFRTVS